jgi:hypothetical protein
MMMVKAKTMTTTSRMRAAKTRKDKRRQSTDGGWFTVRSPRADARPLLCFSLPPVVTSGELCRGPAPAGSQLGRKVGSRLSALSRAARADVMPTAERENATVPCRNRSCRTGISPSTMAKQVDP